MDLITMCLQNEKKRVVLEKRLRAEEQERMDFGGALKEWRLSLGVTAKRMAEDLGISPKRLRRLETGRRVREPKLLRRACEFYLDFEAMRYRYQRLQEENKKLQCAHENITVQFGGRSWQLPVNALRKVI